MISDKICLQCRKYIYKTNFSQFIIVSTLSLLQVYLRIAPSLIIAFLDLDISDGGRLFKLILLTLFSKSIE